MSIKIPYLVFGFLVPLVLGSCGHIYTKSNTYSKVSGVDINGAIVRSAVKPNGGKGGLSLSAMVYMAGAASLDGPFLWRIEAEGKEGVHEKLIVHRLKVDTSKTKRSEWFPQERLGRYARFKPVPKKPGVTFANYQIPGELEVMPKEDGDIQITADVSVVSNQRTQRKIIQFNMASSKESDTEFLFIPGEIVKSFGKEDPTMWNF